MENPRSNRVLSSLRREASPLGDCVPASEDETFAAGVADVGWVDLSVTKTCVKDYGDFLTYDDTDVSEQGDHFDPEDASDFRCSRDVGDQGGPGEGAFGVVLDPDGNHLYGRVHFEIDSDDDLDLDFREQLALVCEDRIAYAEWLRQLECERYVERTSFAADYEQVDRAIRNKAEFARWMCRHRVKFQWPDRRTCEFGAFGVSALGRKHLVLQPIPRPTGQRVKRAPKVKQVVEVQELYACLRSPDVVDVLESWYAQAYEKTPCSIFVPRFAVSADGWDMRVKLDGKGACVINKQVRAVFGADVVRRDVERRCRHLAGLTIPEACRIVESWKVKLDKPQASHIRVEPGRVQKRKKKIGHRKRGYRDFDFVLQGGGDVDTALMSLVAFGESNSDLVSTPYWPLGVASYFTETFFGKTIPVPSRLSGMLLRKSRARNQSIQDWIYSFVERTLLVLAQVRFAYTLFFQSRLKKTSVCSMLTLQVLDYLRGVYGHENLADTLTDTLNSLWMMMGDKFFVRQGPDSPRSLSMQELLMMVVALPFMPSLASATSIYSCFENMTREFYKRGGLEQQADFASRIFEFLKWLFTTCQECFVEKSFAPFQRSVDPWLEWHKDALKLLEDQHLIGVSIDAGEFDDRLVHNIAVGEMLQRNVDKRATVVLGTITATLVKLRTLAADAEFREKVAATRAPPFYMGVFGAPKTGKTVLIDELIRVYYSTAGKPYSPSLKYVRPAASRYDDGLTSSKRAFVFDDVGSLNPDLAPEIAVNVLNSIMELANTQRAPSVQADLVDKGRIYAHADCVFVSSNSANFGCDGVLSHPSAYHRRIKYKVSLSVKPEYRAGMANALDTAKVAAKQRVCPNYRDFQTFTVSQYVLVSRPHVVPRVVHGKMHDPENHASEAAHEELIGSGWSSREFFAWYREAVRSHIAETSMVTKLQKYMEEESECIHGDLMGRCLVCCSIIGQYHNPGLRCPGEGCEEEECLHLSFTEDFEVCSLPHEVLVVLTGTRLQGVLVDGVLLDKRPKHVAELRSFLDGLERDSACPLLQLRWLVKDQLVQQGGLVSRVAKAVRETVFDFGFDVAFEVGVRRMLQGFESRYALARAFCEATGRRLFCAETIAEVLKWLSRFLVTKMAAGLLTQNLLTDSTYVGEDDSQQCEMDVPDHVGPPVGVVATQAVASGAVGEILARSDLWGGREMIMARRPVPLGPQGGQLAVWKSRLMENAAETEVDPYAFKPKEVEFELDDATRCLTPEALYAKVVRNQFLLKVEGKGTVAATGLHSDGRVLTVSHHFPVVYPFHVIAVFSDREVVWVVTEENVVRRDVDEDFLVFVAPQKWKTLLPYFPKAFGPMPRSEEVFFSHPGVVVPRYSIFPVTHQGRVRFSYNLQGYRGWCGGLSIARIGKSTAIVAMHQLGTEEGSGVNPICVALPLMVHLVEFGFSDSLRRLREKPTLDLTQNGLKLCPNKPFSTSVHRRSYVNFRKDFGPHLRCLGSIPYGVHHDKTRLVPTPLHGMVRDTSKVPPDFRIHEDAEGYHNPYNDVVDSLADCRATYPKELLNRATRRVVARFVKKMKLAAKAAPLDEEISLNGLDGVRFVDAFKRTTGQGLPKRGTKEEHILDGSPRKYTKQARESVAWIAEGLARHENRGIVADVTLKDELKKPKKAIRGFAAMPFGYNDIMRRLVLPVFKIIQENPLLFGISIGVNAESYQWRWLFEKHAARLYHIFYDFKHFDRSHSAELLAAAHEVLMECMRVIYADDDTVCGQLWHKVAAGGFATAQWPVYNVNDTIFEADGSLASGMFHTAMVNSICQAIILEMLWLVHQAEKGVPVLDEDDSFAQNCSDDKYGDDGMLSTDVSTFNLPFFARVAAEWNLTITDPGKRAELPVDFPIAEWSFLKRSFRVKEKEGWVLAPLEIDSILKAVNYWEEPHASSRVTELLMRVTVALEYLVVWETPESEQLFDEISLAFAKLYPDSAHLLPTREAAWRPKLSLIADPRTPNPENFAQSRGFKPAHFEALWHGKPFQSTFLGGSVEPRPLDHSDTLCALGVDEKREVMQNYDALGDTLHFQGGDPDQEKRKASISSKENGLGEPTVALQQEITSNGGSDVISGDLIKFDSTAPQTFAELPPPASFSDYAPAPGTGELGDFLRRPIEIHSFSWTAATASHHIDPWVLWLSNTVVRQKLLGYRFFRGTLRLSIQLNGTPFHYGSILVSYEPCNWNRNSVDGDWMQHSNCPHVFLDPNTNTTGEFRCTFISPFSWIDLTEGTTRITSGIGVINFDVLSQLRLFQGGTPAPVYVQMYGWIEDMELAYPTTSALATFVSQGGDEYEVTPNAGLISGPAATVASVAGRLRDAPIIGRFALATEIGARALGAVAKLFGYSRPTALTDVTPMRQGVVADMVHTDTADGSLSLTVNAKPELSIDPCIVGYQQMEDELTIKNLACRWTLGDVVEWDRTQAIDTELYSVGVFPGMFRTGDGSSFPYRMTSLALVNHLFDYWHGTLEVRVKIVASRMHRGRLRFQWSPESSTNDLNLTYNHVVDISDMREYCISLPYVARTGFLLTDAATASNTFSGYFKVIIQNQLVCPSDEPIYVWLSVRAADDIRFAVPKNIETFSHHPGEGGAALMALGGDVEAALVQQGGDATELGQAAQTDCVNLSFVPSRYLPEMDLIFFGDPVRSFRALMKRYTYVTSCPLEFTYGQVGFKIYTFEFGLYPAAFGYSTAGNWETTVGTDSIFMTNTTVAGVLEPCFLGKRGSFRHVIDFSDVEGGSNFTVQRRTRSKPVYYPDNLDMGTPADAAGTGPYIGNLYSGWRGAHIFPEQQHAQRIHVQLPFYSNLKYTPVFDPADLTRNWSTSPGQDLYLSSAIVTNTYHVSGANTNTVRPVANVYSAAGEDFTMFFFRGVPLMYEIGPSGLPGCNQGYLPP